MAELCTEGHSHAGTAAPAFRDCSQAAIDAGRCGAGDWDWCGECTADLAGHLGSYWANVGYTRCPDWAVAAMAEEARQGGQCKGHVDEGEGRDARTSLCSCYSEYAYGVKAAEHFYYHTAGCWAYTHEDPPPTLLEARPFSASVDCRDLEESGKDVFWHPEYRYPPEDACYEYSVSEDGSLTGGVTQLGSRGAAKWAG